MAETLSASGSPITSRTHILDLGAGYGGAARFLTKRYGCRITCLNLSAVQNERNVSMNQEAGLDNLIKVIEGSFEDLPKEVEERGPFDVVWSQDSFLHSSDRGRILDEIAKVLSPKEDGRVVFTDLMAKEDAFEKQPELMRAMMARLHLESLATVGFYRAEFARKGFRDLGYWDGVENFGTHYARVGEELEGKRKKGEMRGVDQGVIEKQAVGMRNWVRAAEEGCVDWGIFCFGT
ncbi:MAG: hypothetical protein Q9225_004926 [Loekoesia sp. 1 TL-2023]